MCETCTVLELSCSSLSVVVVLCSLCLLCFDYKSLLLIHQGDCIISTQVSGLFQVWLIAGRREYKVELRTVHDVNTWALKWFRISVCIAEHNSAMLYYSYPHLSSFIYRSWQCKDERGEERTCTCNLMMQQSSLLYAPCTVRVLSFRCFANKRHSIYWIHSAWTSVTF